MDLGKCHLGVLECSSCGDQTRAASDLRAAPKAAVGPGWVVAKLLVHITA